MKTDAELLRCYVEEGSDAAFTELVQRHLGLVYSVALRRVAGDTHLAEDVAQKVFTDLARKADSLRDRATVSGWLYTSTHLAAAAIVRGERRRRTRETAALTMQTMLSPEESNSDWMRLRPMIDDAIVALRDEDREAIALRFFEKRSFAEVGAALRVTEEAARKRVDRSLDKLRVTLARRGVTSTAAALGLALAAVGTTAVPVALASKVASSALTHAAISGSSSLVTIAKALLPAAAVVALGVWFIGMERDTQRALQPELVRLEAQNRNLFARREENARLARLIADVETLRHAHAELPSLRAALAATTPVRSSAAKVELTLTPAGTINWENEPVKLHEFITRLKLLQTQGAESQIVIRAPGSTFSALAYVIDETRKAEIKHVVVESDVKPDPKFGWWWF
jgi:RNA polymerase sigma factor (sigma-70 family)